MREGTWPRIDAVLATTHPIEAYGGIQLAREALEDLAKGIHEKPMHLGHDIRNPMRVRNVTAEVRDRDDGEAEVRSTFEIHPADLEAFKAELDAAGAPGGFSVSALEPVADAETGAQKSPILVAADAHHFSDAQLQTAQDALAPLAATRINRLYQFSFEPPATVAIVLAYELLTAVGAEMLGTYLYTALQGFLFGRSEPAIFNFHCVEEDGRREVRAYLQTNSERTLRRALDKFGDALAHRGLSEYQQTTDTWQQVQNENEDRG